MGIAVAYELLSRRSLGGYIYKISRYHNLVWYTHRNCKIPTVYTGCYPLLIKNEK